MMIKIEHDLSENDWHEDFPGAWLAHIPVQVV